MLNLIQFHLYLFVNLLVVLSMFRRLYFLYSELSTAHFILLQIIFTLCLTLLLNEPTQVINNLVNELEIDLTDKYLVYVVPKLPFIYVTYLG